MSDKFDVDQAVRGDMQKVGGLLSGGERSPPPVLIEKTFWSLAMLSMIAMVVVLPWVGADKAIPGQAWLGFSMLFILMFIGLALLVRIGRQNAGNVDRELDRRYEVKR